MQATLMDYGTSLPTNTSLEDAVIGSVLMLSLEMKTLIPLLSPDDFYHPQNQALWKIIAKDFEDNGIVDRVRVESKARGGLVLAQHESLDRYIDKCTYSSYEWVVAELRNVTTRRRIYLALQVATRDIKDQMGDLGSAIESIDSITKDAATATGSLSLTPSEILAAAEKEQPMEQLRHGVRQLDKFYEYGMRKGQTELVFGPTGHGKTTVARWRAGLMMKQGKKGLWLQLEGSKNETAKAFILELGRIKELDHIRIYDEFIELSEIIREIRSVHAVSPLDFVVVDYLQEVTVQELRKDKRLEVAHVSKTLRRLMKDLNIFGLFVAQPSRGERTRRGWDTRPRLSDLAETSQLEKDAYVATGVFRPSMVPELVVGDKVNWFQDGEFGPYNSVVLEQLKCRDGQRKNGLVHLIHTETKGIQLYENHQSAPYIPHHSDVVPIDDESPF